MRVKLRFGLLTSQTVYTQTNPYIYNITPRGADALLHNNDVIMDTMASQITSLAIFTQPFIQAEIKENIKSLRHCPLCGKFTGDWWIRHSNGQ